MRAQNTVQRQRIVENGLESQVSKQGQGREGKSRGLFGRFCESLRFGNLRKFLFGCAAGALIGGVCEKANAEFVFGEPIKVPNVNYVLKSEIYGNCDPEISADSLELYFRSNRPGGKGNWDIWVAKRDNIFCPWKPPENLGPIVNDMYHISSPSISVDGLELYFNSSRPGALGWEGIDTDWDIWVTTRETRDSPWKSPENLGPIVNDVYHAGGPYRVHITKYPT